MKKKYNTEEERREAKREYGRKYRLEHREELRAKKKKRYQENKLSILAERKLYLENNPDYFQNYYKQFKETKKGRSIFMACNYRREDKKYGRDCTVTREWIVDHIFSASCIYCGEKDWLKLGCDRKDNTIGHTPENCVPCCFDCNTLRGQKSFGSFINRPQKPLKDCSQSPSSSLPWALILADSVEREGLR